MGSFEDSKCKYCRHASNHSGAPSMPLSGQIHKALGPASCFHGSNTVENPIQL